MKRRTVFVLCAAALALAGCAGDPRENYESLLRVEVAGMETALLLDPGACRPAIPVPEPTDPANRLLWLEDRVVYLKCLLAAKGDPAKCAACETPPR